ncbi:MAG: hypothetical protein ABIE74_06740 [Pseudomonadota bacterium]
MIKKILLGMAVLVLAVSLIYCSKSTNTQQQPTASGSASVTDDNLIGVWSQNTSDANSLKTMALTKASYHHLNMEGTMGDDTKVKGSMTITIATAPVQVAPETKATTSSETATAQFSFYDTDTYGNNININAEGKLTLSTNCNTLTIVDSQSGDTVTFTSKKTACSDVATPATQQPATTGAGGSANIRWMFTDMGCQQALGLPTDTAGLYSNGTCSQNRYTGGGVTFVMDDNSTSGGTWESNTDGKCGLKLSRGTVGCSDKADFQLVVDGCGAPCDGSTFTVDYTQ